MDDEFHISGHAHQLPVPMDQGGSPGRGILVNGTSFVIHADRLEHAQIVALAHPDRSSLGGSGTSMTVSYHGGPLAAPDGILAPREGTPIADGESFVVTRTDKS